MCPFCARRGEIVFGVAIVASLTAASCDRSPNPDGGDTKHDTRDMRAEYGVARPPPDAGPKPSVDAGVDDRDDLVRPMQKYGVPSPPISPSGSASANASAAPPTSTKPAKPPGDPLD